MSKNYKSNIEKTFKINHLTNLLKYRNKACIIKTKILDNNNIRTVWEISNSPPTGRSLGTPPVNSPPIGGTEPDGLPAALPLAPPVAALPPLGSENQNQWTGEKVLCLLRARCVVTELL